MQSETKTVRVLIAHPSCELYGTDRVLLESVDGFLARGWDVAIAVPVDGPLIAELRQRGVRVIRCGTPVLRKALMSPKGVIRLFIETAKGTYSGLQVIRRYNPDVIYVNTITIPLWTLLGKLTRKPVLTHVHEAEESAPRLLRTLLALPIALATTIVGNSRYSADIHAAAFAPLKDRSLIIYNGVPAPREVSAPREVVDGPLKVLYVGRLSYRKGVDVAIDAVAELRNRGVPVSLDIVGSVYPGYESYEHGLRESVREQDLEEVVTFHGFHHEVSRFREKTDVAVVTSRFDEPFGNTAVETLLAGRPLIVSQTSGLREAAAGYGSAQFVPPGSAIELANALQRVAMEWEKYRGLAMADAHAAATKHSLGTYRQSMSDAVQRTAGAGR